MFLREHRDQEEVSGGEVGCEGGEKVHGGVVQVHMLGDVQDCKKMSKLLLKLPQCVYG